MLLGHWVSRWVLLWSWIVAGMWMWKAVTVSLGLRRVPDLREPRWKSGEGRGARLAVVVPARDEEATLEPALRSLLQQDYGALRVIAVDDRSCDGTRQIMDALAEEHPERLGVMTISELPEGWLGKTHAMAVGAEKVLEEYQPEWLLFTDADVVFSPEALRRSVAAAEEMNADHFVTLPTPILRRADEAAFLSFFQVMSFWAVRLWRVSDPRSMRDSIGVGAFALLRSSAYRRIGGFAALRMEILEDLYLGRRVKALGLRQRVAFGRDLVRIHWASGALGIVGVLTKNLFAVFRFRLLLLLFSAFWLLWFAAGPFAGLCFPATRVPSVLAVAAMAYLYRVASKYNGVASWAVALAPFSALLLTYSLLRSAFMALRFGGVRWRGTFYAMRELRAQAGPLFPRKVKAGPAREA